MSFEVPLSSSASSPDSAATNGPNPQILKSYSCILCAQRKVKCDKAPGGCSNCAKARVSCIYKAPPPPRRRKKGVREIDVHTRLRIYEDALRSVGIDPKELENAELSKFQARKDNVKAGQALEHALPEERDKAHNSKAGNDAGVLVAVDGKSLYLDNGLWTSLKSEFRDSRDLLDESSDEEAPFEPTYGTPTREACLANSGNILFGSPSIVPPTHPTPVQVFKLWQKYLDNINPLVKIFHTPTVQQLILEACGHLDDVPKNVEALMFAIYSVAIPSMTDEECKAVLGEPKDRLIYRFRSAAQFALVTANVLKTNDIMVLQALTLFLMSLQNHDAKVMWILTGIAGRIGQRIGLHRDGESLGLPPFETEVRRRLWWQIMFLEGFAEKLAGAGGNIFMGDTKPPRNINDSDLFSGMKEAPKEHEGATEMMFFLIRCHVGEFLKRSMNSKSNFDGVWNKLSTNAVSLAVKDKAIQELEDLFQHKFLQYCDYSVPWHFMCAYLAKAIIFMMRFIAHNPEVSTTVSVNLPASEKDLLFNLALQVTSFQNLAYSLKEMHGFVWHVNMHFQWKAFIYLVSELSNRTEGKEADDAWKEVSQVYEFHPDLCKAKMGRALHVAIGNITLRAWDVYTAARGLPEGEEPAFIQKLRAQRKKTASKSTNGTSASSGQVTAPDVQPTHEMAASNGEASTINLQPNAGTSSGDLNVPNQGLAAAYERLDSFQWDPNTASDLDAVNGVPELPPLDADQMDWSKWESLLVDFSTQDEVGGANGFAEFGDSGFGVAPE